MPILKKLSGKNDLTIYDSFSEQWWDKDSPYFKSLHSINIFRTEQILKWVGNVNNKSVLDIGCGGGLLAKPLIELGAKLKGIDTSVNSITEAEKVLKRYRDSSEFSVGDARNLTFDAESFDIVLLADVIEHIDDKQKVIQEIARVLKPGGLLYVNTINKTIRALFTAIYLGEGLGFIPKGTHSYSCLCSLKELLRLSNNSALKIIGIQGEKPRILKTITKKVFILKVVVQQLLRTAVYLKIQDK